MSLYHELKRRNVFRVAIAYLALAWLLVEVAGTLFPGFGIPAWAFRFVVIMLALGFIPVLIFSWAYEITPEGVKREKDVVRDESVTHRTSKRLDGITIGLIVVALVFILGDRFWLSPRLAEQISAPVAAVTEQVAAEQEVSTELDKSIAVLPFVNMSSDPEQDYFSDGISEELLNLLTKIPELRVISRSSAFSFKGKGMKIAEVARELNVAHILEGSVRKAGNQVRITAQLIETRSDTHLWSETYDRTLDDIFAIQDEIAGAVVAKLKITLLGEAPTALETDPEAFELYLLARQVGRQDTTAAYEQSIALYQQALAIAPDFDAAWVGQAAIYFQAAFFGSRPYGEAATLAHEAIEKALAINPDNAKAYALLGGIALFYDGDLAAAAQHFQQSLELKPADPDILSMAAFLVGDLGRLEEAIELREYVVTRDPVNPRSHFNLGHTYLLAGHLDKAIASFRTVLALSPEYVSSRYRIGVALLAKNEPEAALAEMREEPWRAYRLFGLSMAYHALGQTADSDAALADLIERYEQVSAYNIAYVLAFRGEVDLAFEWLDKAVKFKDSGLSSIPVENLFANIHADPRWLPFLESIGKSPQQLDAIEFKVTLPE
jgi:TolB-like protein/Flp pilus assembly protein TadD